MLLSPQSLLTIFLAITSAHAGVFVLLGNQIKNDGYQDACDAAGMQPALVTADNVDTIYEIMQFHQIERAWVGGYINEEGKNTPPGVVLRTDPSSDKKKKPDVAILSGEQLATELMNPVCYRPGNPNEKASPKILSSRKSAKKPAHSDDKSGEVSPASSEGGLRKGREIELKGEKKRAEKEEKKRTEKKLKKEEKKKAKQSRVESTTAPAEKEKKKGHPSKTVELRKSKSKKYHSSSDDSDSTRRSRGKTIQLHGRRSRYSRSTSSDVTSSSSTPSTDYTSSSSSDRKSHRRRSRKHRRNRKN